MAVSFEGLHPEFSMRLQAFLAGSGGRIWLTSGFRSVGRQQQLWDAALAKYGDPEIADNWVARPGHSNHNHGTAGDLGFADDKARSWAHANAAKYGLHFPMSWEPWHIEPTGLAALADREAYTNPPPGQTHPADEQGEDPHDPGTQFRRLIGIMGAPAPTMDSPQMPAAQMTPEVSEPQAQAAAVVEGAQTYGR